MVLHSNNLLKSLPLQFKGWSRKRRRSLSLLRLLSLPEELQQMLPLLMLLLKLISSLSCQHNSWLILTKLLFRLSRAYLLSNWSSKRPDSDRGWSRKRRRKLSLSRLYSLPEELLWVLKSRLISAKLLFKLSRAYLISNLRRSLKPNWESKRISSKRSGLTFTLNPLFCKIFKFPCQKRSAAPSSEELFSSSHAKGL